MGSGSVALRYAAFSDERVVLYSGANLQPIRMFRTEPPSGDEDLFGSSVLTIPDRDGDLVPDLVVGVPGTGNVSRVEAISSTTGQRLWTSTFALPGLGMGASLALGGDVTGDGVADIIVGGPARCHLVQLSCPLATFNALPEGMVAIISGADGGLHLMLSSAGSEVLRSTFGLEVSDIGDLDGDGVPDVVATSGPTIGALNDFVEILAYSGHSRSPIHLASGFADSGLLTVICSGGSRQALSLLR